MRLTIYAAVPDGVSVEQYLIAGTLPDAITCTVRHEYNTGVYQLDMTYIGGGENSHLLQTGNAVCCKPVWATSLQTFRIAKIRKTLTNAVSVTAYHISYLHGSEICTPFLNGGAGFTARMAWDAGVAAIKNPIGGLKICSITSPAFGAFGVHILKPGSFRDFVFKQLIPAYGGQIRLNNVGIRWEPEAHTDRGVRLVGRVNVVACTAESDTSGWESGIFPFYGDKSVGTYIDTGSIVSYGIDVPHSVIPMDFTSKFEARPNSAQLLAAAEAYAQQRAAAYNPLAITVDRVPDGAMIEPGDTVHIDVPQLGIKTDRIATAVVYNALTGSIDAVEVGDQDQNTLAKILAGTK